MNNLKYLFAGVLFGIVAVKSEIISWFRIQEMFRLHDIHMYGVIGMAVFTGAISILIIKKFNIKTIDGNEIKLNDVKWDKGKLIGGAIFGLGWALTGACPGPIYAQVGSGYSVIIITLISAILGTYTYGSIRHKLPH